jgi:phosphoglycerate dehydrogenase-like enzyme
MKPRSLFINAARGMVVDTEALRTLARPWPGGAA